MSEGVSTATASESALVDTVVPRCSAADDAEAWALCTVCAEPFSADYLGLRLDGRSVCYSCAQREDIALRVTDDSDRRDPIFLQGWRRAFGRVLLHPQRTFAARFDGSARQAIIFGCTATMVGFFSTNGWNFAFHAEELIAFYQSSLEDTSVSLSDAAMMKVSWAALPIVALLRFALGALLLQLGVRVVVGKRLANPRGELRAFSLASGALLLCVIPVLGPFIAVVAWISAVMAYLQVRYGLGTGRGLMAILPSLLVTTAIGPTTFVPG